MAYSNLCYRSEARRTPVSAAERRSSAAGAPAPGSAYRRRRAGAPVRCNDSFGRAAGALNPAFATVRQANTRAGRRVARLDALQNLGFDING
jgi:hypothetical protein